MQIFRLYAYAVNPQRTVDLADRALPSGGPIDVDTALRSALDSALRKAQGKLTRVSLHVDTNPAVRTSDVRDQVLAVAFGSTISAVEPSAQRLAMRLSEAMDLRSPPGLFLVAAYRDNASAPKRQVALWVFPRGDGFRFHSRQHRLQLVKDFFDRNSTQRKLALFSGQDARTQFLSADVLDFQAGGDRELTDLWVERFLDGGPAITREGGTRTLAKAFRETSKADLSSDERQQMHAAVTALRQTPQDRWSLESVGDQFLSPELKERFLTHAPNDATRRSEFSLDRDLFAQVLNFRVFRLENDVFVSSPLGEIGKAVKLESNDGDGREHLEVAGAVVEDQLAQRRRT